MVFHKFWHGKVRENQLTDHWKARLKISKIAEFESDSLKTHEDIAAQSHEILQTCVCVCVCVCVCLGGGGTCPPPNKRLQIFATLRSWIFGRITFKLGSFTNFKALFPVVSTDFS